MANNNQRNANKIPVLIRENPIAASILSKLTSSNNKTFVSPLDSNLPTIALGTYQKVKNNEDILLMFPDIELAIQILVSSIISPNDMIQNNINYKIPDIKIQSSIKQTLIEEIKTYISTNYDLETKLPKIIRETLFTKGAYIEAIVPEASLDDIISQHNFSNVSHEDVLSSIKHLSFGFLGNGNNKTNLSLSIESDIFTIKTDNTVTTNNIKNENLNTVRGKEVEITQEDLNIEITDNFNVFYIQKYKIDAAHESARSKVYKNHLKQNGINILDKFFKPVQAFKQDDYVKVNLKEDASRESIGKPMIINLPTESVIPVHVENDPSKHLGYFVLLDDNGIPIVGNSTLTDDEVNYYNVSNMENDSKMNMIKKAANSLTGMIRPDIKLENLESIYSNLVETMIKKKLKSGMFGELATIKEDADIFRTMFIRALRAQQTKILFLPSELVSYYAVEFRENGTGKSWMEKASVFYSIKAILLFSRVMAYLKNGTSITEIAATLDEQDPNPTATAEKLISEALKTRQNMLPLGVLRPDDIVDWVQKNGMRFNIKHPGLPNMDISYSDTTTSKTIPDDELDNIIKSNIYMSFGLTPEIVESGYSSDFATTVVAKNLLFAKRISNLQNKFNSMLTEHIRKLLVNDMTITAILKGIIENNIGEIRKFLSKTKLEDGDSVLSKLKKKDIVDYILNVFLNEIEVYLPSPETPQANNMKESYENYKTMLDDVFDALFTTENMPNDYFGNISDKLESIKAMYKSACLMRWLADNNYMPEVAELVTKDDNGNYVFNAFESFETFVESIGESYLPFLKKRLKGKSKLDEKLEKVENPDTSSSSSDDESYDDRDYDDNNPEEENNETSTDEEGEKPESEETDGEEPTGSLGGDDAFDDDFGGNDEQVKEPAESKSTSSSKQEKDPTTIKLEQELIKARIEKEKANALKAKADAAAKLEGAGLDKTDVDELEEDDSNNEPIDESQNRAKEEEVNTTEQLGFKFDKKKLNFNL